MTIYIQLSTTRVHERKSARAQELKMLDVYLLHQHDVAKQGEKYDLTGKNCTIAEADALNAAGLNGRGLLPFVIPNWDMRWGEGELGLKNVSPRNLIEATAASFGDWPTWAQQRAYDPILFLMQLTDRVPRAMCRR